MNEMLPWQTDAYATFSSVDIAKAHLEVRLLSASGGEYAFTSEDFHIQRSFHSINSLRWKATDSTLNESQLKTIAQSGSRFPEYKYHYEVLLLDSLGNTLSQDAGTYHRPNGFIRIEKTDSINKLSYDDEFYDQCTIKIRNKGFWSKPELANRSAYFPVSADSVVVLNEGICIASFHLQQSKKSQPRLSLRDLKVDSRLPMLPVKKFTLDKVTLTAGGSFAERQYPGSALSTPYYTGGLQAQLNLFGLPFNAAAYGLWLRNSTWPNWVNSPQNYFQLAFDRDRFDQQYALDLSDDKVRQTIEKKKNIAIRDQISLDQALIKMDSNQAEQSLLAVGSAALPNASTDSLGNGNFPSDTTHNKSNRPSWFGWLRFGKNKGADKGENDEREDLEQQQAETQQKIAEYDRLLQQVDSARASGGNLSITEISPMLIKEFAQSGLINRQLTRLQTLEVGSIYPRRFVNEQTPGINEYRGASVELSLIKDLSLYTMAGSSRFSIANGGTGSALTEGGIIKKLGKSKLSMILSRETSASPFQRRTSSESADVPLKSYDKTFLIAGYEQQITKTLSAGISGEQRLATFTKLDSLGFVGRYHAYSEAAFQIVRLRVFGEYVDRSFFRNIYLGPIPGSVKGGVETGIQLFKGRVSGLFGYETLIQSNRNEEEGSSKTVNSGFKYALSTAFAKVPNVSIAYHPFYTSSRAQFNGNRTIVSYSSQSSLSQATISYAYTGGKYKMSTAVQAQRITNAITYDLESSEQQVNSQVDALFGTLSAFNQRHTYTLSASHQQFDTTQNQNASVQYEWVIKPFRLGARMGMGRTANEMAYQFAAIVKLEIGDFRLHLEPGVTQFDDGKRFYPTLQIQLSKDLWK